MNLNVRNYNNKEQLLFPASVGDYLPKDHLARIIDEVVGQLDLRCLYKKIPSVGNPSYHPKMMLKILFYGYATAAFSSRNIAKGLDCDVAFIFLSGMQKPDFRTISDFRKNNTKELSDLFVQVVSLCRNLGLVELGHISLDSTVIKANANRGQFYDNKELAKEEELLKEKIQKLLDTAESVDSEEDNLFGKGSRGDELPEELRDSKRRLEKIKEAKKKLEEQSLKRINLTDHDAAFQGRRNHPIMPGYRAEAAVDDKKQVIVACDVISKANDTEHLIPLIEQLNDNLPEVSAKESVVITADSNYSSMGNLKKLDEKGNIDAYIPDVKYQAKTRGRRTDEDSPFHKKHFIYNKDKDAYICLGQKELVFSHRKKDDRGNNSSIYRCKSCKSCRYFGICTRSPKGREIKAYDDIEYIYKMRKKLNTDDGRRIYRRRMTIIEPVFGNIKHNLKFKEFLLRGLKEVKAEFTLIAIAHNIRKIAKSLTKQPLIKPSNLNLIPLPAT